MPDIKKDMGRVQALAYDAYKSSGCLMALLDGREPDKAKLSRQLEDLCTQMEGAALETRALCETHQSRGALGGKKPLTAPQEVAGYVELNEYGWLHICLNTLLPNCRFTPPSWLTHTIVRLLDQYDREVRPLPRFDPALLIIDERCDVENRQVFDQDNKGWKAVSNAIKGRLIPDDDQFTLSVCLLSTRSPKPECHIYLLAPADAGDFFFMRNDNYPMFMP